MSYSETLCKGSAYEMTVDENGKEAHVQTMSLSGQDCTGEPCMRAKAGEFPNWKYTLQFKDAFRQMNNWWGGSLPERLRHGENITLAYKKDNRSKCSKLETGDVIYEVAYDVNYKKGNHYTKDGRRRYKVVFTKA